MISIIVAFSQKTRAIGENNNIPWNIPSDLSNFRKITTGGTVVMGRKTYESIGKPLPKRSNVVLTRNELWNADGVRVIHNINDVKCINDVFIIGGEEIYKLFLPLADFIYASYVDCDIKGDTYFPEFSTEDFPEVFKLDFNQKRDEYPYELKVHKNSNSSLPFDSSLFTEILKIRK